MTLTCKPEAIEIFLSLQLLAAVYILLH